MSSSEDVVRKHMTEFCKVIPKHVEKWHSEHQNIIKQVEGIVNLSEQLRYVTQAELPDMDNFNQTQEALRCKILKCIEEDYTKVVETITRLGRLNNEFKTKLKIFEESTLELDWDNEDSILIKGTPTIPPLERLLQAALAFSLYFTKTYKNIFSCSKHLDWLNEEKTKAFEKSFKDFDVQDPSVNYLLAITQFID